MGGVISEFSKLKKSFSPCIKLKMFLTRSEYDRSVNTFSPEGRLFQVEYAIEAIKLGSTAIGIQTSEGTVLAVEKRITSPLMVPSTIEKIVEIDNHLACAFSGLTADSKMLIERARVEAQNRWFGLVKTFWSGSPLRWMRSRPRTTIVPYGPLR